MWLMRERARRSRVARVGAALLLTATLGVMSPTPAGAVQPPRPSAQDGFVPIDQLPPEEQVPAAPLLVGAYAVAWVAILGYVWSIWRRLAKVEREMVDVARRLDTPLPK